MSQTSISSTGQAVGVAGQVFDNAEVQDLVSLFNTGTASIPFGCGVVVDTSDASGQGCKLPSGSGDSVAGVSAYGANHQRSSSTDGSGNPEGDLDGTGLKQYAGLSVMRKGRILVLLDSGVTSISPFVDRGYLRYSANGSNTQPGAWAKAADSGHTIDMTAQSVFVSPLFTAADGSSKVAVLEVDFTNS